VRVRTRDEHGSAVVDFVLVLVVLIPLFLGILQVALVLLVRNTLSSAAAEGARYAATLDHDLADGRTRTHDQIAGALSGRFARSITVREVLVDGRPTVEVVVRATVPALGIGGPGVSLAVAGHAVEEPR
jgi:Flp pilus assembly protein TadG